MTKAERIKEFNGRWRILHLKLVINNNGRLILDRRLGIGLYLAGVVDWITALTEAKQIMEMKDDGGAE